MSLSNSEIYIGLSTRDEYDEMTTKLLNVMDVYNWKEEEDIAFITKLNEKLRAENKMLTALVNSRSPFSTHTHDPQ